MGCATGLVKLLVFTANFIFVLAGIGLITVGVLYKLNVNKVTDAIPSDYNGIGLAPTLTIVLGSIIFCIAFLGCCGALRESPCLLTTFAVILLVIFIIQIALGVYVFLEVKDQKDFEKKVDNKLTELFNKAKNGDKNAEEAVGVLQNQVLKCCGIGGPEYWGNKIPDSCYRDKEHKDLIEQDCLPEYRKFLTSSINVIGITVLAISATEVIGSIFSLCLANSIKNQNRRSYY